MRMNRATLRAVVGAAVVALACAACGAGPSNRPGVAVEQHTSGTGGSGDTNSAPPPKAAELPVPKSDLTWRNCTEPTLKLLSLGPAPQGLTLDCAEYTAPIDASGAIYGTFTVGLVRARFPQTPTNVAPLILTSGSDRPSSATLAGLASGPVGALLTSRPIVAIDRRGIGNSTPIDCLKPPVRSALDDNAQFGYTPSDPTQTTSDGSDPVNAMANVSETATTACKDFLQPQELAFDAGHAADDIEQLRLNWQVDTIGIIGTGNGATVALDYAAKHPGHVGRLILDSPETLNADVTAMTESQVTGAEAALSAFATRCIGVHCSLGSDPRAAVADVVRRAGSGDLGSLSANAVLTAISGFLGSPRADQANRISELADALSAAQNGDVGALSTIVTREQAFTASDGEFVARCTDAHQRPTPDKVRELEQTWDKRYPVFGKQAAIAMMACTAWPVVGAGPPPKQLKLPVLVLNGTADPVVGNAGLSSVTGAIGAAGGNASVITWQGWGHPVLAHSGCAQQAIVGYVKTAELPANGMACPA
ncbi:alpha/beta hydrolase [Skermania sp. ID1734]|uniref:alpha/beta hydrolase n=1 Tax=Skermania sp. ID1734 TaxID=2597516 RepID=UPI00117BF9C7|nr:alpha/beta hydrolase [Skermania sp. ID1734]TSD96005.1 alpha/beta hydrolase [Skermania sp. ID1734]